MMKFVIVTPLSLKFLLFGRHPLCCQWCAWLSCIGGLIDRGIIREKTREIDEAGQLISGIMAQTNLLAHNAMRQVACCGEAGTGFARAVGKVKM